jgi:hypothetical protein
MGCRGDVRRGRGWETGQDRCFEAVALEARIRADAEAAGLRFNCAVITAKGKRGPSEVLHWMFDDASGRRVLDYWPSRKSYRCPLANSKGFLADHADALDLAERVAAEWHNR